MLGKGSYGKVVKINDTLCTKTSMMENLEVFTREVVSLSHMRRQSKRACVQLHDIGYVQEKKELFMHLQVWQQDLHTYTKKLRHVPTCNDRGQIIMNIVNEVNELHQSEMLHRDLKAANILINSFKFDITLADFGTGIPFHKHRQMSVNSTTFTSLHPYFMDKTLVPMNRVIDLWPILLIWSVLMDLPLFKNIALCKNKMEMQTYLQSVTLSDLTSMMKKSHITNEEQKAFLTVYDTIYNLNQTQTIEDPFLPLFQLHKRMPRKCMIPTLRAHLFTHYEKQSFFQKLTSKQNRPLLLIEFLHFLKLQGLGVHYYFATLQLLEKSGCGTHDFDADNGLKTIISPNEKDRLRLALSMCFFIYTMVYHEMSLLTSQTILVAFLEYMGLSNTFNSQVELSVFTTKYLKRARYHVLAPTVMTLCPFDEISRPQDYQQYVHWCLHASLKEKFSDMTVHEVVGEALLKMHEKSENLSPQLMFLAQSAQNVIQSLNNEYSTEMVD